MKQILQSLAIKIDQVNFGMIEEAFKLKGINPDLSFKPRNIGFPTKRFVRGQIENPDLRVIVDLFSSGYNLTIDSFDSFPYNSDLHSHVKQLDSPEKVISELNLYLNRLKQ